MTPHATLTLLAVSIVLLSVPALCLAQGDLLTEDDLVYRGAFALGGGQRRGPDLQPDLCRVGERDRRGW